MEQSKFYQIKNVTECEYTLVGCDGSVITRPIQEVDKIASAFTIQDAKDGDVLFLDLMDGKTFIYNGVNPDMVILYSFIISNDGKDVLPYRIGKPNTGIGNIEESKNIIYPATKEQRDLLFSKMHEAGWEWDEEKKELKMIEQKLANSAKTCKNDSLLDLLNKMPSCITVDGIDYHFVLKKTIAYMAFYEGEGEGSGKVIFWMAGDPVELLTAMLEKLKKEGLLE